MMLSSLRKTFVAFLAFVGMASFLLVGVATAYAVSAPTSVTPSGVKNEGDAYSVTVAVTNDRTESITVQSDWYYSVNCSDCWTYWGSENYSVGRDATVTKSKGSNAGVPGTVMKFAVNTYWAEAAGATTLLQSSAGFTVPLVKFTVTSTGGGSGGSISPATQSVTGGNTTTFTLAPGTGFIGSATGCGGSLSGNTYTTGAITAACTVTATFDLQTYSVTGSTVGTGSGTVTGGGNVNSGGSATLTATPSTNSTFTEWSTCTGTTIGDVCYFTKITSNQSGTANFTLKPSTFTVISTGGGSGGSISPATQSVTGGNTTTFTLAPGTGFIGSATGCGGSLSGNTYTTGAITAACTVTATFDLPPTFILSATADPIAGGTVTGGGTYNAGEVRTVTATPLGIYKFNGWSGACTGAESCSVRMDGPKSVTANFIKKIPYVTSITATPNPTPAGGGNVTITVNTDIDVKETPYSIYLTGRTTPCGSGSSCSSTQNVTTDTTFTGYVNTDPQSSKRVTVTVPAVFTLSARVSPNGGSVSCKVGGVGVECKTFNPGTVVDVTASPLDNYNFSNWSESCTESYCQLTMDANKSVTANFTLKTFNVTPSAGANGSISPSTVQAVIPGGATSFTVKPEDAHYSIIVGGTCNGSLSGTTYTTNAITAACTVAASFPEIRPTLTSFTATPSSLSAGGGTVTLKATTNQDVGPTHYYIRIYDGTTQICTISSSNSCSVDQVVSSTKTFTANVENSGGIVSTKTAEVTVAAKSNQTITFSTLTTARTYGDGAFTIAANATSLLPVTFTAPATTPANSCSVLGSSVTINGAGTCTIRGTQAGDTIWNAAPAKDWVITINKATPIVTWSTPASITYGTPLGSPQLNAAANVVGSFSYTPLAGTILNASDTKQMLSVTFSPTAAANYFSQNSSVDILVTKASQSIAFAGLPAKTLGNPDFPVGGTSTSGGALSFSASPSSVCTMVSGNVHLVSTGDCTITASQAGGTNWYAATNVSQLFNVASSQPNLTVSASVNLTGDVPYLSTLSLTGSVTNSGGTYTGNNTWWFTDNGGTNWYTIGSAGTGGTVTQYSWSATDISGKTLSFRLCANPPAGQTCSPTTGSLKVVKAIPYVAWSTPATITYGTPLSSAGQLNATSPISGTFAYTPADGTVLSVGSNSLSVLFSPIESTNYTTRTKTQTLQVDKASQTVSFSPPASKTLGDPSFSVTATSPGGPITFSVPVTASVCSVTSGGTISILSAGTCTVRATSATNTNYNAGSTDASITVTASPVVVTTVTVATPSAGYYPGASYTATAKITNNGPGTATLTGSTALYSTIGGSLAVCASGPTGALASGASLTYTCTGTVPSTAGTVVSFQANAYWSPGGSNGAYSLPLVSFTVAASPVASATIGGVGLMSYGTATYLTWTTANVSSCTLNGIGVPVTMSMNPVGYYTGLLTADKLYTLACVPTPGSVGTPTSVVTARVTPELPVVTATTGPTCGTIALAYGGGGNTTSNSVFRSPDNSSLGSYTQIANSLIASDTGTPGRTYYYQVKATNANVTIASIRPKFAVASTNCLDYSLSSSASTVTVPAGQSGSVTITRTLAASATTEAVTLSASVSPANSGITFLPFTNNPSNPTSSSVLSFNIAPSVPAGNYAVTVTGNPLGRTKTFILTVAPQLLATIDTFSVVEPPIVPYKSPTFLRWTSSNTASCTLSGGRFNPPWVNQPANVAAGSYTTGNLTANTTYTLSCAPLSGMGGNPSTPLTVLVLPEVANISPLTGACGVPEVSVSWPAAALATSYKLHRATASTGPFGTPVVVASPFKDTAGLTAGTTYYYKLESINAVGSSFSPVLSAVASAPCPPIVVDLTADGGLAGVGGKIRVPYGGSATLRWTSTNASTCSGSNFPTQGAVSNSSGVNSGAITSISTMYLTCSR